jgi:hypothetical protein
VISRVLVMVLALGAAVAQASRGAWAEAAGLTGLALGLAILRWAPASLRWLAWVAFAGTAAAIVTVMLRMQNAG